MVIYSRDLREKGGVGIQTENVRTGGIHEIQKLGRNKNSGLQNFSNILGLSKFKIETIENQ